MPTFGTGHYAAELLASIWDFRASPAFARHIELVYGVSVPALPDLKCLYGKI